MYLNIIKITDMLNQLIEELKTGTQRAIITSLITCKQINDVD